MGSIKEQRCQVILEAFRRLADAGHQEVKLEQVWAEVRGHQLFPHYSAYETFGRLVRWLNRRGALERLPDQRTTRNVTWKLANIEGDQS